MLKLLLAAALSLIVSRAPSSARTSAQARPNPLLAPPMMATFPCNSKSIKPFSPFRLRPARPARQLIG